MESKPVAAVSDLAKNATGHNIDKPRIAIRYCTLCNWMLRSAWLAQELLHSFNSDLAEVSLRPDSGGVFEVWLNDTLIWERKRDGGFPEAKELKRRVRDLVWPERDLGHVDRAYDLAEDQSILPQTPE